MIASRQFKGPRCSCKNLKSARADFLKWGKPGESNWPEENVSKDNYVYNVTFKYTYIIFNDK